MQAATIFGSQQLGVGLSDGSSAANAGSSALQIKQRTGTTTDGLYWIKPPTGTATQVFCDMTTDGGGWMLIARTHPSAAITSGNWGWRGTAYGSTTTYTDCYQLPLYTWYTQGFNFTSYVYGNQLTNNSNSWGPFIYKVDLVDVATFLTSDTQQGSAVRTTLQANTNVYGSINPPGMQSAIGFPITGTANSNYYMRDCCGYASYGINPTGIVTTYVNSSVTPWYSGPFAMGSALNADGFAYTLGGSSLVTNMGGTNQVMIMVR
jgi:hypothetical protein